MDILEIKELLKKINYNDKHNIKIINKYLNKNNIEDVELLYSLVTYKYDSTKCLYAIKALLLLGCNPNFKDDTNQNFIQLAINIGYDRFFIEEIIKTSLKHGLDINNIDDNNNTILHTALYSNTYTSGLNTLYEILSDNGFDISNIDLEDDKLNYIINKKSKKSIMFQIEVNEIKNSQNTSIFKNNNINNYKKINELGNILNNKQYKTNPCLGRDREFEELILTLASDKNPIIIGKSGIGKTTLVEKLAYEIKNNIVPAFLKNKIILEISTNELVAGCKFVGQFEEKIQKLMETCNIENTILFIDEIHTIYGTGSSSNNDNDMATMLKYYIDRHDIKIIGTTTILEYQKYFQNSPLKRRFEKIELKEPDNKTLFYILDNIMDNNKTLEDESIRYEIIKILINITSENKRIYNDIVNNPDLVISILNKAYAYCKVYDSNFLKLEYIIKSIKSCSRIYESAKELGINEINKLQSNKNKEKILKINFNK